MTGSGPFTPLAEEAIALIDALFEDRISPDRAARLQELVVNWPEIARLYVQYSHLWCALPLHVMPSAMRAENLVGMPDDDDETRPLSSSDAMILPAMTLGPEAEETPIVLPAPPSPAAEPAARSAWWRTKTIGIAAAIALPILVGIVLWSILRPAKPAGMLVASSAATWEDAAHAPHDGQMIPAGPLSLTGGLAQMRLENGVLLIVEGPTQFEIRSQNTVAVNLGKITVSVPPNAHGFTIVTPSARSVDLGTEFGVLVDDAGNTETHVIRGTVEMTPTAGGATTRLTADNAARVDLGADATQKIPCLTGKFVQDVPAIDLADVIAGGDGTQRLRNAGIDVADGRIVITTPADSWKVQQAASRRDVSGDGRFHPCPGRPLIGGVFVPHGGATPDTLDPAGHVYNFPPTNGRAFVALWSGNLYSPARKNGSPAGALGSVDYSASGHGMIILHANKGVALDLSALRNAHPDRPFTHLQAVCGNLTAKDPANGTKISDRSELWVFVDGDLRSHKLIHRTDPPFDVDVPIESTAHFLTLVATDGGDGYDWDWVTLGDPRLK